jgi:hypothetical protein
MLSDFSGFLVLQHWTPRMSRAENLTKKLCALKSENRKLLSMKRSETKFETIGKK